MTMHNFSIEDLALALIVRLDRKNIFPPLLNDPESFLTPADGLTNLSFRRPKRSPNAFLVCRKNVHEEAMRRGTFNMRVISKVTGILWKNASTEEKAVYKKLADRIYEIHYRRTSTIYKKITTTTLKEKPTFEPYYSFPVQLKTTTVPSIAPAPPAPSMPLAPLAAPLVSHTISLPSSPIPISVFPTFNFESEQNEVVLKDNNIEFQSYNDFNNQIISNNYYHQPCEDPFLPYFIDNVLIFPQDF